MFDPVTAIVGMGALGIGSSLIGGSMQADAIGSAAQTQANAANQANQLQYQMFKEQQQLMQPWVQSGQGNLARLNYAMFGQTPSANQMQVDPNSQEAKNWFATHPQAALGGAPQAVQPASQDDLRMFSEWTSGLSEHWTPEQWDAFNARGGAQGLSAAVAPRPSTAAPPSTLFKNPLTGEISATVPNLTGQFGVQGGGLNPDWRFSTQDWKNSPEFQVYAGARDAALQRSQDALMAQGAASGMYGSGTMANALTQNMGQLYAQYDPASLAAARQAAEAARTQEFNQLAALSNPSGAQQVAQYAGMYGQNAGQNLIGAGNAMAQGRVGEANAWGNALTSGTNQIANAYGQYQGGQNFNQLMNMYAMGGGYNPNVGAPGAYGVPVQSGGATFYGNMPFE